MRCSLRDPTLCCESECAHRTILATCCPFYLQKNSFKYFERKVGYSTNGSYLWHAQIYPSAFKVRYEWGEQERKPCQKSIFPGSCSILKNYSNSNRAWAWIFVLLLQSSLKNGRRKIKFSKWTICHGCFGWKQLLSNINLANCSKIISGGCFPFFSNSARPCVGYCCPSVRLSIVQSWSSFWLLLLPSREIWSCFDHHSRSCAMIKSLSCQ